MDDKSIRAMVIAHASEISAVSTKDIRGDTTLRELELDSLETICFVTAIEDSTGVDISCVDRICIDTIDQAVDLILNGLAGRIRLAA